MRFKSGTIPWNKGIKLSEKHCKNLSISHLGKQGRPRKIRVCSGCGKEYWAGRGNRRADRKYCSFECYKQSKKGKPLPWLKEYVTGERNCNWKGGASRYYKTGYYGQEYKNWRRDVFVRDEFTCKECGVKHTYITAHHIKSWAHFPDLRFDVNNGITLCEDCHEKTDNYKGRNNLRRKTCPKKLLP